VKSQPDSVREDRKRSRVSISYPWIIVLMSALILLIGSLNKNTFGVFFKPITDEFGWSRGAVAGALALTSIVTAIFSLLMGYLSDRYGPRRVILPCCLSVGVSYLLFSWITSLWQLYLVQSLILGIALSVPFVCLMSTVAKWHPKRPGLALGITSAGTGLSAVIFPPIAAGLIQSGGWRDAMIVLSLVTLIVAVPASLFIKDPPSAGEKQDKPANRQGPFEVWRVLPGLLKNRVFLSISVGFFLFYISCNLLTTHLVNYVTDTGISPLIAAAMVSVMGIVSTVSRLAMGTISDRIGTRVDAAVCCSAVILSLVLLMLKTPVLMWISVALLGIGWGGMAPLIPAIMADHFGWGKLATLTGAVSVGANLGGATGPWMGGFIFDVSGSYFWALALCAAFTVIALTIILRMPSASESRKKGLALPG
jgi:MFS family permease